MYKNEQPIFSGCCLENESITSTSWNTWSKKYCTRYNGITKGLIRGHCWYCNNCNTYLLSYLSGHRTISYNINETTLFEGTFKICKKCNRLSLSYFGDDDHDC